MVAPLAMLGANLAVGALKRLSDPAGAAGTDKVSSSSSQDGKSKMKKTADDFEKMFLENSLDRLTQSDGQDGPLGEAGTGGGVYRSMLSNEYAGQIVKSGGVGISQQIYSQLLKLQGDSGNAGA